MMGKLPKSEAWKQSDLDKSGLLLHPRYSSIDSIRICHAVMRVVQVFPSFMMLSLACVFVGVFGLPSVEM
jgi:hypothetical protein